ncbi:MAG TPA: multicopper oxidase domain-containing protein [Candidatus Saccharimonadales bacterium]|nr:multicopper oxidase domain-containing protein [Candidatus Saccharimonadales bacterium]
MPEPQDLRSQNGTLKVELRFLSSPDANNQMRYCYFDTNGHQAPNLRVHPGDTLILLLKNEAGSESQPATPVMHHNQREMADTSSQNSPHDPCAGGPMIATSTNLHFHGLVIPPVCHQDETLKTLLAPTDPAFEFRFQIPKDTPPGLYWYHPHPHGFSKAQVLGGASGALIVEGIEQANDKVAGLAERVWIIRDQDLVHPDAEPMQSGNVPAPIVLRDAEGDAMNTGTGNGKPAKDLSVNFVPVSFPQYQPATIRLKPAEREFWRVLNASAITYLDLQLLFDGKPQALAVVALDGVPVNENGSGERATLWKSHILLPPAGRAEFIIKAPTAHVAASFVTRTVDTGPAGENDPTRPLATLLVSPGAPEPQSRLPLLTRERAATAGSATLVASTYPQLPAHGTLNWLGNVKPVRERKLYFSEEPLDAHDPNSPTKFYITVDGEKPVQFDPNAQAPNIVVHQGDVEDWIIENRSTELHAFHIHQVHFLLTEWNGVPLEEPYLRDTINVSYWNGRTPQYPSVKLRMDFRDPRIVGTFMYHCHLLEHEDGGMMGIIRVDPAAK